jgi:hypothetical protein
MQQGETVTLTYKAKIQDVTEEGTYRDLAWAAGDYQYGNVLAEAGSEGYVAENFVGTEVTVAKDPTIVKAEVVKEEKKGEVLGARTLPATGLSVQTVAILSGWLFTGVVLVSAGLVLKKKRYERK